jgi:hypothetical protein
MLCATATLAILIAAPKTAANYALRLNLHQGDTFKCKLLIERDKPKRRAELVTTYTISKVDSKGVMYMDCRNTRMTINGKDRTKELNTACGGEVATFPWTPYSRRTGTATYMHFRPASEEFYSFMRDSGVYLACFQRQDAKVGDSWEGSTTATGGCTGAIYNLRDVKTTKGKQFAYFELTRIRFLNSKDVQVGPMRMVVEVSNGVPTVVDYKVKNTKTGVTSHFRQTREI